MKKYELNKYFNLNKYNKYNRDNKTNNNKLKLIKAFYSFGAIISFISIFITIALFLTDLNKFIRIILSLIQTSTKNNGSKLVSRSTISNNDSDYDDMYNYESETSLSDSLLIKPVIPGWTSPLSDLPAFLLSFFVIQSFHELGHALSAITYVFFNNLGVYFN